MAKRCWHSGRRYSLLACGLPVHLALLPAIAHAADTQIPASGGQAGVFALADLMVPGLGLALLMLGFGLGIAHSRWRLACRLREEESRRLTDIEMPRRRAEDREARLQAILDWMGEGLVTFDELGKIEFVNPAIERMFRCSGTELVGAGISRLVPVERRDLLKIVAAKPPASGVAVAIDAEGVRGEGEYFPLEISLTEYRFGGRRLFAALFRDVSERRTAENRVHEAEARLREAIEFLPDAFVLYDADDRLVICNERYRELYRTSADLIVPGMRFEHIIRQGANRGQYRIPEGDREAWIRRRMDMHRNPPEEPLEQNLDDGRWLRVFERRMPDGRTVGFRIDITELKLRQAELERSEGRLRALVSGALDAIIILDEACHVVDFNPAAERISGYRRDEIVGRPVVGTLVPERHREMAEARFRRIMNEEGGSEADRRINSRARRRDGSEFHCEIAMNCAMGPNGKLLIAFARDVTEERAKAAALQEAKIRAEDANRAKANFLAMMSHEIRTPLNAVMGILDFLRDSPLNSRQRRYVRTATDSATALLNILNDILDLSRLEARRLDFINKPFAPRTLAQGVRDLFMARAEEKRLTFTVTVDPGVPARLVGDAGRIRQVLINLVGNAIKFTEAGNVNIHVSAADEREGRANVSFVVSDTGPGIAPQLTEVVFQKFTTLDNSRAGNADGVGLGLAICRELVEGMGGTIALESALGEGCRFSFALDLAIAARPLADEDERKVDSADIEAIAGARVLLAEDNRTNRMMTVDLLERWGCRVDCVADGREALQALDRKTYDVVLMDVSMPVLDGVSATQAIRARGDKVAEIPIIAFTAHALVEERDRALQAGMSDFVTKPVSPPDLLRRLVDALQLSREAEGENAPLIDREVLKDVLDNLSGETRNRVLAQFMQDMREKRQDLMTCGGDIAKVERATHVLNSLAGTFGAEALFRLSDEANRAALAGDAGVLAEAPHLVNLIDATLAALIEALAILEADVGEIDWDPILSSRAS
ncbi:PAS domain S-box protein [Stappia sp. F7233]|uniref:Sensory/regulatory protein RpfC n=1 Tax=Stappia albiluteola TaxID=2758565 RepID=A0A839AGK3_9HYPH|nr:PAS domain S-box protein [Stappia albiluteola]MBA5778064.1 PAS domain S-box protein [Stappia albiluteola]